MDSTLTSGTFKNYFYMSPLSRQAPRGAWMHLNGVGSVTFHLRAHVNYGSDTLSVVLEIFYMSTHPIAPSVDARVHLKGIGSVTFYVT